jgi:hypothetical protein
MMFEPSIPTEEVRIAVSLPIINSIDYGTFISLDALSKEQLTNSTFDALMVSGLSPNRKRYLSAVCKELGTLFIAFDNPSNDMLAINNAVSNLIGKLVTNEVPNNIDLADIKNLMQCSELLYAFNDSRIALDFLATQKAGETTGAIYFSHGRTDMKKCEEICNELLSHISQHGNLCFSVFEPGDSECTILLGIPNSHNKCASS